MSGDDLELVRGLVAIPSLSRQERPAVEWLVTRMAERGFRSRIDEAGNAVGERGSGQRHVVLLGHIDTVPGAIPVRVEDGELVGRGAVDAKGPLAAFVAAATEPPPGLRVTVVGAVEEESPTSRGARHVATRPAPDWCVVGEPSGWDGVTVGYKGRLVLRLAVERSARHGAAPGPTIAEEALALWESLRDAALARGGSGFERLDCRLEGMAALPAQAKLAQELGCKRSATWVPPGHNERAFAENFKLHVDRIGPAAKILADHGIALGLEFIGPKTLRKTFAHRFIYTMEGMLAMGTAMGTGNVGLLLDIWHLYTSHGSLDQVRELDASEVVVVHINDAPVGINVDEQMDQVRTLPGETGVLDIAGFLQALDEIGYDGPVTVEPFSKRVREMAASDAVAATAEAVQKVWSNSGVKG